MTTDPWPVGVIFNCVLREELVKRALAGDQRALRVLTAALPHDLPPSIAKLPGHAALQRATPRQRPHGRHGPGRSGGCVRSFSVPGPLSAPKRSRCRQGAKSGSCHLQTFRAFVSSKGLACGCASFQPAGGLAAAVTVLAAPAAAGDRDDATVPGSGGPSKVAAPANWMPRSRNAS
jgi:hypothetical protein